MADASLNGNGSAPEDEPALSLELAADDWAHVFFATYLGTGPGNLTKSAKAAGVHPKAIKRRIETDLLFADLKEQADLALLHALEEEAFRRARDGTERPIFQHGEVVGHVREVDNRLLQWLLERLAPEKYHLATLVEHVSPDTPGAFTFRLGDKPLELEAGD